MRRNWDLAFAAVLFAAAGCAATGSDRTEARFPYRIAFETRHAHVELEGSKHDGSIVLHNI